MLVFGLLYTRRKALHRDRGGNDAAEKSIDREIQNYKTSFIELRGCDMNWEQSAQGFAAIGSEARLQVLKALVRAGRSGMTVGEIQEATSMPASTLAHHLRLLAAGEVIHQEKIGRSVINRADFERLEQLAHFILCESTQTRLNRKHKAMANPSCTPTAQSGGLLQRLVTVIVDNFGDFGRGVRSQ